VYVSPAIELRNAGVDTNVFNSPVDPIPDTSVVLRPALNGLARLGERLQLSGNGYLDLNYYRRRGSERSIDFAGEGRAELRVGPAALLAGGGGGQFKQRFSIDLDQRVKRQEKWGSAGVRLELGRRISGTLGASTRTLTFEPRLIQGSDIKEALDRETVTAAAELRYALTRKTRAIGSFELIEDRFLRQRGLGSRQVRSFRYLAGFELSERALVSGRILAGVRRFPGSAARGGGDFSAPALSVNASLPFLRQHRLALIADRDILYSAVAVRGAEDRLRNAFVFTRYRAEATLALPLDLVGRAFASFEEAKYLRPFLQRGAELPRIDHQWSFGGSVLRPFGRSLRLGANLTWIRRISNLELNSYQGARYGLQGEWVP
jgi:hypothetical protein